MTTVDNVISMQPVETWAAVPNFRHLEASSLGRIRSSRLPGAPYVYKTSRASHGYLTLCLTDDAGGARRTRYVHDLVASAFLGPKPAGKLIMHLDDNKENNAPANLAWGTYSDNLRMAWANGRRGPRKANTPTPDVDIDLAA